MDRRDFLGMAFGGLLGGLFPRFNKGRERIEFSSGYMSWDTAEQKATLGGSQEITGHLRVRGACNVGGTMSAQILAASEGADISGVMQCDELRIDQTPAAETPLATHTVTINCDGVTYRLLAVKQ